VRAQLNDHDYLLPQVQAAIIEGGIEIPRGEDAAAFPAFRARIASILAGVLPRSGGETSIPEIAGRFARMLVGVGVLQPLLEDPGVEEVMVRPQGMVFIERSGRVEALGQLAPDEHFYRVAAYVADTRAGRMLSPQYPVVLVDLAGGERFTALTPPLSPEGTVINIRRWQVRRYDLAQLQTLGTFGAPPTDAALVAVLAGVLHANAASILVSGAFSTGKTTLLNAVLAQLPPDVMVAVAEAFRELDVHQPGTARVVVPPFVREGEERITLAQAVNSLLTRARPDVMVLGEITSFDEAREFLRAGNLGVRAMATIHGNSAESALVRLADLAIREGVPLRSVREQAADAVDLVVHMNRMGGRRYVAEVAWVRGVDDAGHYRLELVYRAGQPRIEALAAHLAPLRTGGAR
jgi:pilus assembly protein CpaF